MDSTDLDTDESKKFAEANETLQIEQEIEYFLGVFTDIMTEANMDADVQQVGGQQSNLNEIYQFNL
jgi:hypothetical protein